MQVDLYADDFPPHGSKAGYEAGCRSKGACPNNLDDHLPTCSEANTRYQADYGYRLDVNAGLTVGQIAAKDAAPPTGISAALAAARARDVKNNSPRKEAAPLTSRPSTPPTSRPVPKPVAPQTPSTPAEAPTKSTPDKVAKPEEAAGVDGTLTPGEVATILGIDWQALRRLHDTGKLVGEQKNKGAHRRYQRSDVDAYLDAIAVTESQPEEPQAEVLGPSESAPTTLDAAADGRGEGAEPPAEPVAAVSIPEELLGTSAAPWNPYAATARDAVADEMELQRLRHALAGEEAAHAETHLALSVARNALAESQRDALDLNSKLSRLMTTIATEQEPLTGGAAGPVAVLDTTEWSSEGVALQIDPTEAGGALLTFTLTSGNLAPRLICVDVASSDKPGLGDLAISVS